MSAELALVIDDQQQMTVEQLAQYFGVSVATMRNHLKEGNIEPDVRGGHGGTNVSGEHGGSTASTYEFRKIKNYFSKSEAGAVSADAKAVILHDTIEDLRKDFSPEAAQAKMANALGFMQMLYEQLQHNETQLINEKKRLELWKHETEIYVAFDVDSEPRNCGSGRRSQIRGTMDAIENKINRQVHAL